MSKKQREAVSKKRAGKKHAAKIQQKNRGSNTGEDSDEEKNLF